MTDLAAAVTHFDPLDPALSLPDQATGGLTESFWSVLRQMQSQCPVVHSAAQGGFSVLTRRDDVVHALQDWETFSSAQGVAPVLFDMGDTGFKLIPIDTDPPYQRSVRKLLNPYFSPPAAKKLEPAAREIARELVDKFASYGRCDFMLDFAYPFPSIIFFKLVLGLDEDVVRHLSGQVEELLRRPEDAAEILLDIVPSCARILQERRSNRRDDVLDGLVHGEIDGRRLTDQEQLQAFVNLIIGGLETTANGLGSAMKNLASRPDLRERLAAGANIDRACDEFLRFESPVAGIRRLVTKDTEIGGTQLRAGDWVYVSFGAANLDPEVFPNPEVIDIERPEAAKHAAFGAGPHRCLGSHLARMELRVGLEEVLRRLPQVALDPDQPLTWRNSITRGPLALPLVFPAVNS